MDGIAIIGISCRLPGADSPEKFWQNLKTGTESITVLSDDELRKQGVDIQELEDPNYIKVGGFIDDIDLFDADFFSFTRPEAEFTDPQQRILLELSHQLLEECGYANAVQDQSIGVYASTSSNQYLFNHLMHNKPNSAHFQDILLGNSPDCVATRISYKLNLTGPSMTVQCGCSSGLAAVHQARIALLSHQCNIALVGASAIANLARTGYMHTTGGFLSGDGHCRAFDAKATGTLFSSGAVVLALKRLQDAINDRDSIYAVIKSSAINNDGANKAGFTAPSLKGQEDVIRKAHKIAGISADSISYVEAHGTATPLGDPIEVSALTHAFRHTTDKKQYCALGSVKTNIGHLDVAAGLAGLAKTALALKHKTLPASLHFAEENPKLKLAESPFYVNSENKAWSNDIETLRAGVSAFGFGGTNVHLVVEEAPIIDEVKPPITNSQLILLSAKNKQALQLLVKNLCAFLKENSTTSIADLAYTLHCGRQHYLWRCAFSANSIEELMRQLSELTPDDIFEVHIKNLPDEKNKISLGLSQYWLAGGVIDWQPCPSYSPKRIKLPTYPMNKQSYWLKKENEVINREIKNHRHSKMADCIYHLNWRLSAPLLNAILSETKNYLIFIDDTEDFHPILEQYKSLGYQLCLVYQGKHFEQHEDYVFTINPTSYGDYLKLFGKLKDCGFNFEKIIHSWLLQLTNSVAKQTFNRFLGFYSLIFISQALEVLNVYSLKDLVVLGNGFYQILGTEPLSADKTMAIAAAWGIGQEYGSIRSKVIDVYFDTGQISLQAAKQLLQEIEDPESLDVVVYRNSSRWIPLYEHIPATTPKMEASTILDTLPTYIVIGGLGNVAMVYAHYLAKHKNANIVLVNRSEYSEEKLDPQKFEKLMALKAIANQVVLLSGDVTNLTNLQTVFTKVTALFGKITGIVHAAGIATDKHYQPLNQLSLAACEEVFSPKVKGLEVIAQLTQEYQVKQVMVISSISSVLAGIGLSAYAASHLYLDAFVQLQHTAHCHWSVINWEAWSFYQEEQELLRAKGDLGSELDFLAISVEEGEQILELSLQHQSYPRMIVSTTELNARCNYWLRKGYLKEQCIDNEEQTYDPRPDIKSDYIEPSNAIEQSLVENWQNILGIQPVGVLDNFFELGGHSLLALTFVNLFNQSHQEKISFIDLFNYATIRELANHLKKENVDNHNVNHHLNARIAKQNAYYSNQQRRISKESSC